EPRNHIRRWGRGGLGERNRTADGRLPGRTHQDNPVAGGAGAASSVRSMNERVHFFDEASEEIEAARRWYREQNELAERAFLDTVDHAIQVIMAAPHRWPPHRAGTRRYVLPEFPYSILSISLKTRSISWLSPMTSDGLDTGAIG